MIPRVAQSCTPACFNPGDLDPRMASVQDRALRSMALRCTAQLIMTFLDRKNVDRSEGAYLLPVMTLHLSNVLHQLRRNTFHYVEQKVRF